MCTSLYFSVRFLLKRPFFLDIMSVGSEVCIVLAVEEDGLYALGPVKSTAHFCTLDCMICPWEKASTYLRSYGLVGIKLQIRI